MGTRSTETLDMKFFVVIALAGAAVASPSNRNDDDGAAAALECTAGTNIGDKLANAFSSCFGSMAGMRKEVKRIQLARNDEQCYSYDEIMQWVEEEYADDACVLQSIGWMGNDFEFDEDQIEADVMSLDPVVTAPLFAGHQDCVDQVMDYVEDHECADTFSRRKPTRCWTPLRRSLTTSASFTSSSRDAWTSSAQPLLEGDKKQI